MAGQDLLQQGRAGARQADDEYGIRGLATPTLAFLEKFPRQGADLPQRIKDVNLDIVTMPDPPYRVATLVELERFFVFLAVLQCFPQRKRQVRLVIRVATLGRYLFTHVLDVFIAEAEGFQVGQAPVGFTHLGTQTDTLAIGCDGIIQSSHRLEGMTITHLRPCLVGVVLQYLFVQTDRLFMFSDTDQYGCPEGQKIRVIGFLYQQFVGLHQCSFRFLKT